MPVRNHRVAASPADWLAVFFRCRSAESWLAAPGACGRQSQRSTVRRVAALPSQVGQLLWQTLAESRAVSDDDASLLEARIFTSLLLGCARASWRQSWSHGRWLASACVGLQTTRPRAAVYKYRLRSRHVCLTYGIWLSAWLWPKEFGCLIFKELGCPYDCVTEGVWMSVWLWEVLTILKGRKYALKIHFARCF
jgi:hypothetical protein